MVDELRFRGYKEIEQLCDSKECDKEWDKNVPTILEAFCFLSSCKHGSLHEIPVWEYSTGTILFETDREELHVKEFMSSYFDFIELLRVAFLKKKKEIMNKPKNIAQILIDLENESEYATWKNNHIQSITMARKILEEKRDTGKFIQCRKCKSSEVDTEQKQTRSADEPMTIFCQCRKCGTRFRMD